MRAIGRGLLLALAGALMAGSPAQAQRVLECRFVSVDPSSFTYGQWSFAADISGGYLHLLLARPTDAAPYVTAFDPLRPGVSVHKEVTSGDSNGATATFDMATLGADQSLTLDQWSFGGDESYDRLTLRCPSHP